MPVSSTYGRSGFFSWAAAGAGYFWPLWPMLGMSIAVLVALWRAFGPIPQAGAVAPEPRAPEPM